MAGVGLLWLSRILGHAAYVPDILAPLVTLSVGIGLILFPTTVVAVSGAARHESGLASAVLNVSQQLGGSVGLAVLSTIAASVTRGQLATPRPTQETIGQALTTGFATAFEVGALISLAGFLLALLVIRVRPQAPAAEAPRQAA